MKDNTKQYVIVFRTGMVRDAQIWISGSDGPDPCDDEHWMDMHEAEVLAGVYPGETEADAITEAAAVENCHPDCLRAVGVMSEDRAEEERTFTGSKNQKQIAYEVYKLFWLIIHGYTLTEVLQSILDYRRLGLDESNPDSDISPDLNDAEKLLESWEFEEGIGGNIYSCFNEFVLEDLPMLLDDPQFVQLASLAENRYGSQKERGQGKELK